MNAYVLSLAAITDDRPYRVLGVRLSLEEAKALAVEREGGSTKGQKWRYQLARDKEPQFWSLGIILDEYLSTLEYRIDKFPVPVPGPKSVLHEVVDLSKANDPAPEVHFTAEDIKALSDDRET